MHYIIYALTYPAYGH